MRCALLMVVALAPVPAAAPQMAAPDTDPLHVPFEEILDVNVRDGLVYYGALRQGRATLDRYMASLASVSPAAYEGWARERQMAFWINAYNAFVLRTVIDRFPIRGSSPQYPPDSIRQISGAFERRTFRAAGRELTLDGIEQEVLAGFGDPRVFFALGRGAVGGGRLHSEAYSAARLESQLAAVRAEMITRREIVYVDPQAGVLSVSPVFSWREAEFSRVYADRAPEVFAGRSPLERSVIALIAPNLKNAESDFLGANAFRMVFHDFDWRLNDLSVRR